MSTFCYFLNLLFRKSDLCLYIDILGVPKSILSRKYFSQIFLSMLNIFKCKIQLFLIEETFQFHKLRRTRESKHVFIN